MTAADAWDPEGPTDRFPVVREDDETEEDTPALVTTWWSQAALMARAALGGAL